MNEQELRQLFKNQSDCYADTGDDLDGEKIICQAMTEDRFIEVLKQIGAIGFNIAGAIPYSVLSDSFRKSIDSIEDSLYEHYEKTAKAKRYNKDRSIGLNADE
jgi:hypothetical protein